jgi:hypothetical protein
MAGTGKSTIAHTIARAYFEQAVVMLAMLASLSLLLLCS